MKLTLYNPEEEIPVYKKSGLQGLRQHKIVRISNETLEQGGIPSCEGIAFILTSSVVTIKRDMSFMRRKGIVIPSRRWRHQVGRGQTHKTQILGLFWTLFAMKNACRYIRKFVTEGLCADVYRNEHLFSAEDKPLVTSISESTRIPECLSRALSRNVPNGMLKSTRRRFTFSCKNSSS